MTVLPQSRRSDSQDADVSIFAPRSTSRVKRDILAAIDLGTNNCRLLIAKPTQRSFHVIDAFSRIVRLGEGLGANGCLSEAAMDRTIEALKICARKMQRRGVTRARSVATEACRRAFNCGCFMDRVIEETGLKIDIITAEEEARLAFHGCSPLLCADRPYALVFDIGGGSTEIGWMQVTALGEARLLASQSVPAGVVTLAERYGCETTGMECYEAMVAEIAAQLHPFEQRHNLSAHIAAGNVQMLGSSGTVTTLAGIAMKLPRYERSLIDGAYLDFDMIKSISHDLANKDVAGRAASPCVGRDRADLVVAGCAILEAICRQWPVGRLRVADRGVREGILLSLLHDRQATHPLSAALPPYLNHAAAQAGS